MLVNLPWVICKLLIKMLTICQLPVRNVEVKTQFSTQHSAPCIFSCQIKVWRLSAVCKQNSISRHDMSVKMSSHSSDTY